MNGFARPLLGVGSYGACVLFACAAFTPSALAQVGPDGIDWVTIGAPGNAPWPGDGTPGDRAVGRGRVDYEYKIGRFEVTSAQWVEFFNAAYDRAPGDTIPHLIPPDFWGGIPTTPTHSENPNARRWTTSQTSGMLPTGNISWRMAAIYCNWLCNDKGSARSAFLNGAYDVSTFGYTPGGRFLDQLTHNPDARYWIPTWDEWLKSAHYDPQKLNGDGTRGGWWRYSNGTDTPYVYGPPGVLVNGVLAQANAEWDSRIYPGRDPFSVRLGAYTGVTSPFGLYDVAGATGEWTEEALWIPGEQYPVDRVYEGSVWATLGSIGDHIRSPGGSGFPSYSAFDLGFRVVSSVPSPGSWLFVLGGATWALSRRRT